MKIWKRSRSRLIAQHEPPRRPAFSTQGLLACALLAVALGLGYFAPETPLTWLRAILPGQG